MTCPRPWTTESKPQTATFGVGDQRCRGLASRWGAVFPWILTTGSTSRSECLQVALDRDLTPPPPAMFPLCSGRWVPGGPDAQGPEGGDRLAGATCSCPVAKTSRTHPAPSPGPLERTVAFNLGSSGSLCTPRTRVQDYVV